MKNCADRGGCYPPRPSEKNPQRDMIIYAKGLGQVSRQRPFKFLDRIS